MLVVEIQGWSHIRRLKFVIMTNFGSLPTSNTFGRSRIASDPLWKWLISFSCLNRDHQASKNVERMCLEPDWWRIDSHWTRILVQGKRESVSATCRHCSVMKAPTAAVKWLIGNFLLVQHSEKNDFVFIRSRQKRYEKKEVGPKYCTTLLQAAVKFFWPIHFRHFYPQWTDRFNIQIRGRCLFPVPASVINYLGDRRQNLFCSFSFSAHTRRQTDKTRVSSRMAPISAPLSPKHWLAMTFWKLSFFRFRQPPGDICRRTEPSSRRFLKNGLVWFTTEFSSSSQSDTPGPWKLKNAKMGRFH